MSELRRFLGDLATGLAAALLPSPERERLARSRGVHVAPFSLLLGLIELALGILLFMAGGLAFMRGGATATSLLLLENWDPTLSTTHFQGAGLVNWLAWMLHPVAWLFASVALVGMARCVAYAATREAVPEPAVWALLRLWQAAGARLEEQRRRQAFGPERPDRLERRPDGGLMLFTQHERPDWNEDVTIEVEGRFYRLSGVEQRRHGPWAVLAYRLEEREASEVVRGLVRYRPSEEG